MLRLATGMLLYVFYICVASRSKTSADGARIARFSELSNALEDLTEHSDSLLNQTTSGEFQRQSLTDFPYGALKPGLLLRSRSTEYLYIMIAIHDNRKEIRVMNQNNVESGFKAKWQFYLWKWYNKCDDTEETSDPCPIGTFVSVGCIHNDRLVNSGFGVVSQSAPSRDADDLMKIQLNGESALSEVPRRCVNNVPKDHTQKSNEFHHYATQKDKNYSNDPSNLEASRSPSWKEALGQKARHAVETVKHTWASSLGKTH